MLRELFDDGYLPTAKEQLAHCRSKNNQRLLSASQVAVAVREEEAAETGSKQTTEDA
jgi:hypothetical protein